jgi:membrane-associated phospholipid phosphatase
MSGDDLSSRAGCPASYGHARRVKALTLRPVWSCLVLVGILAIILCFLFLDQAVRQWFQNHPDVWHEHAWVNGFRQLGKAYVVIWLLLLWSCLIDHWRATIVCLVALALVALCVCPLKVMVRRSRPHLYATPPGQLSPEDQHPLSEPRVSFPSGDTAAAFAVATVLSASRGWRWAPLLFTAAGGIGLLRIMVLAHYTSDVLAGAMIGVLCGFGALRMAVHWKQPDWPHMRGSSRVVAGLLLVLILPLAGRVFHMEAMWIFLKVYGIPLTALLLTYLAVVWLRAFRRTSRQPPIHDSAAAGSDHAFSRSLWGVRWPPFSGGRTQRASRARPRATPRSSRQGRQLDSGRRGTPD